MRLFDLQGIIISLPVILVSLSFHEFAHAWAADRLGDPTARLSGRLTMDPLAHIDPFGFILLILAGWGWAKPVPVNPYNFRRPKQGMLYTSLAGPVSNIVLALVSVVAFKIVLLMNLRNQFVISLISRMIMLNIGLAAFNLIPVPPLDGSKILAGLLPDRGSNVIWNLETYGPFILIALVATGAIDLVLGPLVNGIEAVILLIVNAVFSLVPRG
ncbi:MAG: site-2 protease family protein [Chloroflexota bacterium]